MFENRNIFLFMMCIVFTYSISELFEIKPFDYVLVSALFLYCFSD